MFRGGRNTEAKMEPAERGAIFLSQKNYERMIGYLESATVVVHTGESDLFGPGVVFWIQDTSQHPKCLPAGSRLRAALFDPKDLH